MTDGTPQPVLRDSQNDGQTGDPLRVAIVVSRYNTSITNKLRDGAIERFLEMGGRRDDLVVMEAPGAFELPVLCGVAARSGRFEAVVALGCLIRGQTLHDQYIAGAVAEGLTDVSIETGVPVAFGVLTCETPHLAAARAGGEKGNKGAEALAAAVEAARIIASFEQDPDLPLHRLQSKATDKAKTAAAAAAFSSAAGNR